MKQSNHINIMLIIISKCVLVYDEKTKTFLVFAYPSSSEDWSDHSS